MEALADVPVFVYIVGAVVSVGLIAWAIMIKKKNKDQ